MDSIASTIAVGVVVFLIFLVVRAVSRSKEKESELDQKLMQFARVKDPKVICDGHQEYDGGSGNLSSIAKAVSTDFGFVRRDYKAVLIRTIEALNSKGLPTPDVIYVGLCNFDGETPFVRKGNITGKWCA